MKNDREPNWKADGRGFLVWWVVGVCMSGVFACVESWAGEPAAGPYAGRIGVELDGLGDGNRARVFVDHARVHRPWTDVGGKPIAVDERGWPLADGRVVMFDIRPVPAWAPPIDDPDKFQPDWSGSWLLEFRGQADVSVAEGHGVRINELRYDRETNRTRGELVVEKEAGLLVLAFERTRRSLEAGVGSGITGLRFLRPGYGYETNEVFTREFLRSLRPFKVLRYMDWLDTNHQPGFYGDAGHHALDWSGRRRADDATQVAFGEKYGVAWEHVIALANETKTDIWINIPVAATDEYITQLARFLKQGLNPESAIYIEHSNEVWNFGFPQYIYNKLAAIDEVKRGGSALADDGSNDEEVWARRRHADRLVAATRIFGAAFGAERSKRVRGVYASWLINPEAYYADVMKWVERVHGPPSRYFAAVASAAYFNIEGAPRDATPEQLLDAMRESSDRNVRNRDTITEIGRRYGLAHFQYEVGPDVGGGAIENVANRIRANRMPGIADVIERDVVRNWFDRGGGLYMYFAHCGPASRYGCWGLSEDVMDLDTPKWRAIRRLVEGGE
jgi:hypothetical protein